MCDFLWTNKWIAPLYLLEGERLKLLGVGWNISERKKIIQAFDFRCIATIEVGIMYDQIDEIDKI